jgi:hypothetical protein
MAWLKRNLFLVVSGVVALGLLGVAGFYLWSNLQEEARITDELNQQTTDLQALVNRPVHPGGEKVDNIKATKRENDRVINEFLAPARKHFATIERSNTIESAEFQLNLVSTIAELRRMANNSKVAIPPQYAFSFSTQERSLQFDPSSLPALSMQINDIRTICRILFRAKIHRLESIKRVGVNTNEVADGADYIPKTLATIKTNDASGSITVPYQFEIVGHSAEIAQILNGLANAPEFFSVKFIATEPKQADSENPDGTTTAMPPMMRMPGGMDPMMARRYGLMPGGAGGPGRAPGMDPMMMRRYGLGGGRGGNPYGGGRANPYATQPAQPVDPTASGEARPQPGPLLKEVPVKCVMLVETVKLFAVPAGKSDSRK